MKSSGPATDPTDSPADLRPEAVTGARRKAGAQNGEAGDQADGHHQQGTWVDGTAAVSLVRLVPGDPTLCILTLDLLKPKDKWNVCI